MNTLEFRIAFHGPFRVSLGHADSGVDTTLDPADPLPATSLKGVMRATAFSLLGQDSRAAREVFGSGSQPSPWRWSRAHISADQWHGTRPAARVSIDEETHTAKSDMLAVAEEAGATSATFAITQHGHLDAEQFAAHRAILTIAAQATRSVGALRRRGLGWVSIQCTNHEPDEDSVRRFLELKT
ncbi:CRISPR/Cas system CSM-associated protein Csm3 (group 7 of RAMP superfamily) [Saccharopolyspora lacisalsi]|uniref:CRISPR/Cas system CSM-associated protein Csm3 (Group 7 of RAMP superfamily) n=1 Tax=Halosaccharopolyspora lacisalsi TaxID=1000566 RepID=A0A839E0L8_9PSEU|nr:RAMP superfamily CRISPR-associated protein [Halosaccharopolyspora lacisalsi]MBA8825287.1 CRISPR/Cas system CSM-associated protein Csm3 (group 7 of RAMP superfamily) [Halosaccharopolyspora lacisalsi]